MLTLMNDSPVDEHQHKLFEITEVYSTVVKLDKISENG